MWTVFLFLDLKLKERKENLTSCCDDWVEDDEAVESVSWVSSRRRYSRALSPESTQVTARNNHYK
jgi:hypothetical protein